MQSGCEISSGQARVPRLLSEGASQFLVVLVLRSFPGLQNTALQASDAIQKSVEN